MIMMMYFVTGNFRGTYSSINMPKGYMVKERLGTPGLVRFDECFLSLV